MRYLILRPVSPIDPRKEHIRSLADLHELAPVFATCSSEDEAVTVAHGAFPDVLPLIVHMTIDGKKCDMLGFLDVPSDARLDVEARLPFVLFVQAVPESVADKKDCKHNRHFRMAAWMPKVLMPDDAIITPIEIRSTALPVPTRVKAYVGRHQGRLALQFELGGVTTSIMFASDRVLDYLAVPPEASESTATVASDGG